jgi:hypothetical protein
VSSVIPRGSQGVRVGVFMVAHFATGPDEGHVIVW